MMPHVTRIQIRVGQQPAQRPRKRDHRLYARLSSGRGQPKALSVGELLEREDAQRREDRAAHDDLGHERTAGGGIRCGVRSVVLKP